MGKGVASKLRTPKVFARHGGQAEQEVIARPGGRYPCGGLPGFAASSGFAGTPAAGAPPGRSASAGTPSISGSVKDSGEREKGVSPHF